MASSTVSVQGLVTSLSQVFYQPGDSKCFVVEFLPVLEKVLISKCQSQVSKKLDRHMIVVKLKGLDASFQLFHNLLVEPPLGKWFKFSGITRGWLKIASLPDKIGVYLTNSGSKVEPIPEVKQNLQEVKGGNVANKDNLISYEGIVTDDSLSNSAIYTLDQKVTLVLTGISLVSNVRILKRGQRVHLINAHLEKIDGKPVLYVCGRGFVWSLIESDELDAQPDPNPNSIHSKSSQMIFQSSPLIKAALHYNLRVDQILNLKHILVELKTKFSENLDTFLTKRFRETSNLDHFIKILELESAVDCNLPRSLLHEYFVRPHHCNLRTSVTRKRKSALSSSDKYFGSVQSLKQKLEDRHRAQLQNRRQRYENPNSPLQYDFCTESSKYVFESSSFDGQIVIGKIVLNRKTGNFELTDETGSLPVCVVEAKSRTFEEKFLGELVRVVSFTSCLEFSYFGGKNWQTLYLVCHPSDLQLLTFKPSSETDEQVVKSESVFRKVWKVIYSSGPIITSGDCTLFICAVRQIFPPICKAIESNSSQMKFLRLPTQNWCSIPPGSTISAELKDLPPEMFNSHLHVHTKKWGPINCNNKVEILTKNDDISIDFSGSTPTPEFLLSEFDEIPDNEMVNIIGTIAERWLEWQQFQNPTPTSNLQGHDSDLDSVLSSCSVQLKLKDPRLSSKAGSTISVYVTQWSSHPYPLGLLPSTDIRICNVVKVLSKKGHPYFTATLFTTFQVLKSEQCRSDCEEQGKSTEVEKKNVELKETDFIINLVKLLNMETSRINFGTFKFLVTLETLLKVSITALCSSCQNQVVRARCDFVGCHVGQQIAPKFVVRCTAMIEDETSAALLHLQEPGMVQDLLQLAEAEWNHILETAALSGELLYLTSKRSAGNHQALGENQNKCQLLFQAYCEALPQSSYCRYMVQCRPFKSNLDAVSQVQQDETHVPKLFCLDLSKC